MQIVQGSFRDYMLVTIIHTAANLYVALIFIYVLMSWFDHSRGIARQIYDALQTIVEPYLGLFRRIIPPAGGIDFSPVIAVIVLQLIVRLLF